MKIFKSFKNIPEFEKLILVINTRGSIPPFTAIVNLAEEELEYLDGSIEYKDTPALFSNYNNSTFIDYLHNYDEDVKWIYFSDVIDINRYSEMVLMNVKGI